MYRLSLRLRLRSSSHTICLSGYTAEHFTVEELIFVTNSLLAKTFVPDLQNLLFIYYPGQYYKTLYIFCCAKMEHREGLYELGSSYSHTYALQRNIFLPFQFEVL